MEGEVQVHYRLSYKSSLQEGRKPTFVAIQYSERSYLLVGAHCHYQCLDVETYDERISSDPLVIVNTFPEADFAVAT
jgi:hypothetical protein